MVFGEDETSTRQRFKLKEDYRGRLPLSLSRFLGYRHPGSSPPYDPLPPFGFLWRIPIRWEVIVFGSIAAFVSILLVEALCVTSTTFRDLYRSPVIVASFGASAVLVYGVIESPLSQPRNLIGGHGQGTVDKYIAVERLVAQGWQVRVVSREQAGERNADDGADDLSAYEIARLRQG
jgi:hypothetical protein